MDGNFQYRNAVNKLYVELRDFIFDHDKLVENRGACCGRLVKLLDGVQHWTGRLTGSEALPRQQGAEYFAELKALVTDFPIEAAKSRENWIQEQE
jgi:hypothetical protein